MQLNEFREAVVNDKRLQARLRLAHTTDEVVEMARSAGFDINGNDVESVISSPGVSLSEPEMETISGAAPCWCDPSVVDTRSCM